MVVKCVVLILGEAFTASNWVLNERWFADVEALNE